MLFTHKAYGGYANYWRGSGAFVFKIPDAIPSDSAAPMLCGGITTFSPLLQHNAGPGKKVGIIGIGGLGHFGILGAKALGCDEIVAISRTRTKREDAMKMGATKFIATEEDHDWASSNAGTLDLIISTVSSPNMPIQEYLGLLRLKGQFVQVGAPEDKIPSLNSKFQNSSQLCHPFADLENGSVCSNLEALRFGRQHGATSPGQSIHRTGPGQTAKLRNFLLAHMLLPW
jgi:D-arabinose 1-dehydrogenase-like Zn-dependent alcohol dehydrogenase